MKEGVDRTHPYIASYPGLPPIYCFFLNFFCSTEHKPKNKFGEGLGMRLIRIQIPLGTNILSVIARCPQLRRFRYISGRRGMRNPAVECNMHVAAFSELSFSACWQGRLSRG